MPIDRDRAAQAFFPAVAALPEDATDREVRAVFIREMIAAGKSLRWIGRALHCTIADLREDLAVPPRRHPAGN